MKIAVVFLVVAVSSCNGLGDVIKDDITKFNVDAVDVPPLPNILNACLINTLTGSQELILRLALLICTYENGLDKLNDDNWNAVYNSLENVLTDTGCTVSTILDIGDLGQLGKPTSTTIAKLIKLLRPVLDKSGLSAAAFKASCDVTKKMFAPNCVPLLVGGDVPKLLIDLKTQACPGIDKEIVYDDLYSIVKRVSCLINDAPWDVTEMVNSITKDPNGDLVYNGPAEPIGDIVIQVLCILVQIIVPNPLP